MYIDAYRKSTRLGYDLPASNSITWAFCKLIALLVCVYNCNVKETTRDQLTTSYITI